MGRSCLSTATSRSSEDDGDPNCVYVKVGDLDEVLSEGDVHTAMASYRQVRQNILDQRKNRGFFKGKDFKGAGKEGRSSKGGSSSSGKGSGQFLPPPEVAHRPVEVEDTLC